MSENFAKSLKEELQQCADITMLIDCVFTTLSNHQRSREAFIRKVQSAKDTRLISIRPASETQSSVEQDIIADSRTLSPLDQNVSAQNDDILPADVTLSSLIHAHNTATSAQRDMMSNTIASGSNVTSGHVVNKAGSEEGSPADHTILPITHTRRRNTLRHHAGVNKEYALNHTRLRKGHPTCKENIHRGRNLSTVSPSSVTPGAQRRFRGPGKKKKSPPPDFGNPRYSEIEESLRRHIFEYDGLHGLQDLWKMVNAFRSESTEQVYNMPSDSWIRRLQCRIEFCDALERKGESWLIRATIERRFYMVQLVAEYRKAKEESQASASSDEVAQIFTRDLFPGKDYKDVKSTWDYYLSLGTPLLEAVERYGYGVLLFPLRKATTKSLHHLNNARIGDLLGYIDKCHPGLERLLRKLSYVLPKLMIWGLPTAGWQIVSVQLEELTTFDDESFNRLLSPPGSFDVMDFEPLSFNKEILSWSPRPTIENTIVSQADATNDCPSGRVISNPRLDKRQECGSGFVQELSSSVHSRCSYKPLEEFRYESSVQLPPIQDVYDSMAANSQDISEIHK